MEFRNFLNSMKGNYHNASIQEKRNALDVLGVKVYIRKIEGGNGGARGNSEKSIEVTYSPVFTGVNTSVLHTTPVS